MLGAVLEAVEGARAILASRRSSVTMRTTVRTLATVPGREEAALDGQAVERELRFRRA